MRRKKCARWARASITSREYGQEHDKRKRENMEFRKQAEHCSALNTHIMQTYRLCFVSVHLFLFGWYFCFVCEAVLRRIGLCAEEMSQEQAYIQSNLIRWLTATWADVEGKKYDEMCAISTELVSKWAGYLSECHWHFKHAVEYRATDVFNAENLRNRTGQYLQSAFTTEWTMSELGWMCVAVRSKTQFPQKWISSLTFHCRLFKYFNRRANNSNFNSSKLALCARGCQIADYNIIYKLIDTAKNSGHTRSSASMDTLGHPEWEMYGNIYMASEHCGRSAV